MRIWTIVILGLLITSMLPAQEGFSTNWVDTNADPCTDFFQYACGGWMAANPIPGDQSSWGRFHELHERNQTILRTILEEASAAENRTQIQQQIGDYYAACMDEEAINGRGMESLQPDLDRIQAVKSKDDLAAVVARLHLIGTNVFFFFAPTPDFDDSSVNTADVDQAGLGLPERDYYFRDDPNSKELREKYVAHVTRMFELLGDEADSTKDKAATVMRIETALAEGSMEMVKRRDPENIWHKMPVADLEELAPSFNWKQYFQSTNAPVFSALNVDVPEFFQAIDKIITSESLDNLKTYITWQLVNASAGLLPEAFVEQDFDFYRRTLSGAKEMRPRWKRCVARTDAALGEALGQAYVERNFPPESKERMLDLVSRLEEALGRDIDSLPWMTQVTKEKAHEKLQTFKEKIGYPDKWRDYSSLEIGNDALINSFRAGQHNRAYELNKIGKAVDPNEWAMTPPTVNAYYNPLENTINFPAGILQPPFFNPTLDDAVNFGAIGAVIGHEMTHGFDDSGRKFGASGNLEDWWTEDDASNFEAKAKCFIDQYAQYVAIDDVKLNGELTLGENVADNGGLRIAFMALMSALDGVEKKKIDNYTPEQRFFLGWAQVWCTNSTEEALRLQAQTDPHSIDRYRVNGVVSNMPQFRQAFSCSEAQPMVRKNTCQVW